MFQAQHASQSQAAILDLGLLGVIRGQLEGIKARVVLGGIAVGLQATRHLNHTVGSSEDCNLVDTNASIAWGRLSNGKG